MRCLCLIVMLHGSIGFSFQLNTLSTGLKEKTFEREKNEENGKTIVVVGAGVGGISTAARIASSPDLPESSKVIVFEKNPPSLIGGRCGSFYREVPGIGKFRHERGPSLLLLKDAYLDLFRDLGKDAADYNLYIEQCMPAYQAVFDDGDTIQLGFPAKVDNVKEMKELEEKSRQKMDQYEENGAIKWDEYMRCTSAFLDCGLPNFIEERLDLKSFPSFIIESVRDSFKAWPLKPHSDVLDNIFLSSKMKALASFQDLYVGLEPYRNNDQFGGGVIKKTAPAVFGLLAALELHPKNGMAGVFAPIGGFQAVSNAFEKLATDCGVEIQYNRNVQRISKDGIYYQVTTGDEKESEINFQSADLVIVNSDLPYSTKTLIDESDKNMSVPRYDWDTKFDFSSGVIAFHWSINKECNALNTHNVFIVGSSRASAETSWNVLRENNAELSSFDDEKYPFNFYVHRASVVDKSAAPTGCDSIMVLVPSCTLRYDESLARLEREECIAGYQQQFDNAFISKVRNVVLQRLGVLDGLNDLESHIVDEVVDTPASYADFYNLAAGTPFALSHGFGQLSLTRPGHVSNESENILFVGASTRPGNGVPLVLLGSKQVAKKAVSKIKSQLDLDVETN